MHQLEVSHYSDLDEVLRGNTNPLQPLIEKLPPPSDESEEILIDIFLSIRNILQDSFQGLFTLADGCVVHNCKTIIKQIDHMRESYPSGDGPCKYRSK